MDKAKTRKILLIIASAYGDKFKLDESGAKLASWEYHLKEFTFEQAEIATKRYIESGKEWPPHPGQIVALIRRMALERDPIKSPEDAWIAATRIAKQFGEKSKREAAKAAQTISVRLYAVIKKFGYLRLCELFSLYDHTKAGASEDDIKFAKIRFERVYSEYTEELKETGYIGYQEQLNLSAHLALAESVAAKKGID